MNNNKENPSKQSNNNKEEKKYNFQTDFKINREYEHATKKDKYIARLKARLEKLENIERKSQSQKDTPEFKKLTDYITITKAILNTGVLQRATNAIKNNIPTIQLSFILPLKS